MKLMMLKHVHRFGTDIVWFFTDCEDLSPEQAAEALGLDFDPLMQSYVGESETLDLREVSTDQVPIVRRIRGKIKNKIMKVRFTVEELK